MISRTLAFVSRQVRRAVYGPVPDLFDEAFYRRTHPDVSRWGLDPYLHYAVLGWRRGHDPSAHFSAAFYRRQVPGLNGDPLLHYLAEGGARGLDPNPDFSSGDYLDSHPDVRDKGLSPLAHYLAWGAEEGRMVTPSTFPAREAERKRTFEIGTGHASRIELRLDRRPIGHGGEPIGEVRISIPPGQGEIDVIAEAIAWLRARPEEVEREVVLDVPMAGVARPVGAPIVLLLGETRRQNEPETVVVSFRGTLMGLAQASGHADGRLVRPDHGIAVTVVVKLAEDDEGTMAYYMKAV